VAGEGWRLLDPPPRVANIRLPCERAAFAEWRTRDDTRQGTPMSDDADEDDEGSDDAIADEAMAVA
jgi:hypothetical protein